MVVRRFILIKEDKETLEAPEEEGFLVDDKKEITDEDLENITEEPLSLDKQIEDQIGRAHV